MHNQKLYMIHATHTLRVRYGETDPMKYAYYGNYAEYFEVARVELLRSVGMPYSEIENHGVWLPVSEYRIKYLKPALYDQLITIHTYIRQLPKVRIVFDYEIFNEENEKITEASTTLYFLHAESQRIIRCPKVLMEVLQKHWKE